MVIVAALVVLLLGATTGASFTLQPSRSMCQER
jgi:hypothetical protein